MSNKNTENMIEELLELAPTLASLHKKSNLSVPQNYFEDVEEQIISQLNLMKFDNTPQVPQGYLDQLESDVVNWALKHEKKQVSTIKSFNFSRFNKWMYAAAAIFTLAICAVAAFNIQIKKSVTTEFANIEQEQYFDYIQNNIDDFDINSLIENDLIEESDLSLIVYEDESLEAESDLFMESEINF